MKHVIEKIRSAFTVNAGILLAFLFLFAIASVLAPKFLTVNNQLSILRQISTVGLIAFGMTLVILTGGIDLSVGSFMTLCGCLSTILIVRLQMPIIPSVLIGVLVGALFGWLNGLLVTRLEIPAFIATLASMNILRGLSYLITGGRPVILEDSAYPKIGGGYIGPIPLPAIYLVIVFAVFWVLLNRTRYGRRVYAVGGNMTAATYSGINTNSTIVFVYIFSGVLAAFAGIILTSRMNSGQPTIGQGAELDAIAACIVGGVSIKGGSGTLFGTLIGCLIIGSIGNLLNLLGMNAFVQLIIKGGIIVVSVYVDILRTRLRRNR